MSVFPEETSPNFALLGKFQHPLTSSFNFSHPLNFKLNLCLYRLLIWVHQEPMLRVLP